MIEALSQIKGNHAIVSGLNEPVVIEGNIRIFGLLEQKQLATLIEESEYLISRSGYSSIMDYEAMQRRAILIPTPGQTEQEYLAKRAHERGKHNVLAQDELHLDKYILH